ncbi:MAG: acyltransferase [Pseudonocardiaceae bacterium]
MALTKLIRSSFVSFGPESRIAPPLRLGGAARMHIGARVYIGSGSWLNCIDTPENSGRRVLLSIGDDVIFSGSCTLSAVHEVRIGDRALIARGVYISDHTHRRGDGRTLLGVGPAAAVIIGDGAWLGQNSCVLPGVSIGAGAVVGANSVVTENIPPGGVAVGAPARVLKIL